MQIKVAIEGAEFFAYHGFYDEEQRAGNTFIIDLQVTLAVEDMSTDDILNTVNYERLYAICHEEMQHTHRLIETVAYNILSTVQETFARIVGAHIKIQKLAPQLGGKVARSVIEMEV